VTAPTTTELASLPVYERKEVPEHLQHLRTMTQLKEQRLKPAEGQAPVALLRVYRRGHGWGEFPLYDPAGAAKMRPLSGKQQQAMTARRTCPECGEVRGYVVYQRCEDCRIRVQKEAQDRQARTCHRCRREAATTLPKDVYGWWACEHCRIHYALRKQGEEERLAVWRRTCPGRDCTKVTATDEEIAAGWDEDAAQALRSWGWSPRWCPPCKERDERERAEREQQRIQAERDAEVARVRQVRELSEWAAAVLDDSTVVLLDTETTGLEDDARIVDIAVITVAGDVLVDTLVNPGEPIPPEATDIHGITDAMVADAPSFAEILVRLTAALDGRRCLIYNSPYDTARLRHELTVHYRQAGHDDPEASATAWLDAVRFEDAMIPYSDWYGDWSDYWGNYAWQPLYGGDHRAVTDCRAVVERLRDMAADSGRDAEVA
jgi:DNA polymerase III epsilon subunit-like protein